MDYLKNFYDQENLREEVKAYFFRVLDEEVLKQAYKEARQVIKQAFIKLNNEYGKEETKQKDNPAR